MIGITAIYPALGKLQQLMSIGIAKNKKAMEGKRGEFAYRGIEQLMDALIDPLVESKIVVLPRIISHESRSETMQNDRGETRTAILTTVEVEYQLTSTEDGSSVSISAIGCSLGNTAQNVGIAQSYAYRNALEKALTIPFEVTNPEEQEHTIAVKKQYRPEEERKTAPPPKPKPPANRPPPPVIVDVPEFDPAFSFPLKWREGQWGGRPIDQAPPTVITQFIQEFERKWRESEEGSAARLAVSAALGRAQSVVQYRMEEELAKVASGRDGSSGLPDPTT